MRLTDYNRAPSAVLFSLLLLSRHVIVDGNYWFAGRSSRSSTLAVAAPGGRDRPIRDWKAFSRDANKRAEESKQQAAKKVEGAVEALEQAPHAINTVDVEVTDDHDAATADSLDLEKDSPQSLAIMLSKIAMLTAVGIYGAKKVVSFTKAFIRTRKEAASDTLVVDSSTEAGDEAEGQVETEEAEGGGEEEGEGDLAVTEDDDEVE